MASMYRPGARPGQPDADLVVDVRVVEQVEVVQATEVASVVRRERDTAAPPGTRGAGKLHEQIADDPRHGVVAVGGHRGADEVVGSVRQEGYLGATVAQELVGVTVAPVLLDQRPIAEVLRTSAMGRWS